MVYAGILYRSQLFFTHCHAIGASSKTSDDDTIDKHGANKVFKALKRWYP